MVIGERKCFETMRLFLSIGKDARGLGQRTLREGIFQNKDMMRSGRERKMAFAD